MAGNYSDLRAWQLGMDVTEEVYSHTRRLPREERFGLISQMRRAASSIPSNIAEGHRRKHTKEFIQFLYQAYGSLAELETQAEIARRAHGLALPRPLAERIDLLGRTLNRLIEVLVEKGGA